MLFVLMKLSFSTYNKLLLRFNIKKWLAGVKCEQDFDKLYERHHDEFIQFSLLFVDVFLMPYDQTFRKERERG